MSLETTISAQKPIRAAQYVRMSTEHQQYSTNNQEDVIREYAQRRGYEVVRTFADEGKSGLRVAGRESLQRLISEVESGRPDFTAILVYDVSRWGRFQDADESAFYEYLCRRAGIEVHYCAEQFENDGGPTSTIIKSVKRAMAGEYSRELSSKVFKGQCRLIELGYRQGGPPGYGLRRMLINQQGEQKAMLSRGECKSLQTDRVVLVPGPAEETKVVQWIYDQFTESGRSERQIAAALNAMGVTTDFGRPWNRATVQQVLSNEKYIGNNVYNRTSFKLKKKHVSNTPEMWVRANGAFPAIISAEQFFIARGILVERRRRVTTEEMLQRLRDLVSREPILSAQVIDSADGVPSSACYRHRFGSLLKAYQQVGYDPGRDYSFMDVNRRIKEMHPGFVGTLSERLSQVGASVRRDEHTGLLLINEQYTASVCLSRCRRTAGGSLRWMMQLSDRVSPDIAILARMDEDNQRAVDYYLLPLFDITPQKLLLCEQNGVELDTYQFDSLDFFTDLAARRKIEVAA